MTGSLLVEALAVYVPALAYLTLVVVLLWGTGQVPAWAHPFLLVTGTIARVLNEGWQAPLTSVAVAFGIFVVLVPLAGATVSGVTLFSLVVTLALVPVAGWPGVLFGLMTVAVVSVARTWRHLGKQRVTWLTLDTMSAMGVSSSGKIKRPEAALIPQRSTLTDIHEGSSEATRVKIYLPPYLLLGVASSVLLSWVTA